MKVLDDCVLNTEKYKLRQRLNSTSQCNNQAVIADKQALDFVLDDLRCENFQAIHQCEWS